MSDMLFPEYLNKGSTGPAVRFLQYMLLAGGYSTDIVPNANYDTRTSTGVSRLQADLGFVGDDIDGNFGPKTRALYFKKTLLDVNTIPSNAFDGTTHVADL